MKQARPHTTTGSLQGMEGTGIQRHHAPPCIAMRHGVGARRGPPKVPPTPAPAPASVPPPPPAHLHHHTCICICIHTLPHSAPIARCQGDPPSQLQRRRWAGVMITAWLPHGSPPLPWLVDLQCAATPADMPSALPAALPRCAAPCRAAPWCAMPYCAVQAAPCPTPRALRPPQNT